MKQTPFYPCHIASNAKMVDFGGWELPINYGSQIKEHEIIRTAAGMFDVSHMLITDITGKDARAFFRHLLSNDVAKLEKIGVGKALYSGMLNEQAGVIDDLIIYLMQFGYRLVTNAATADKDMAWMRKIATKFAVEFKPRPDLAMLAVQGPLAINKVSAAHPHMHERLAALKPFMAIEDNGFFYARTGYTGENGLEIILPVEKATEFWQQLLDVGVAPCGLGARDTLRLEAGMNLYGHDMNEDITPLACGMDWVVDLSDVDRDFMGKNTYQTLKAAGDSDKQVGLILEGKGVLREGQNIIVDGATVGIITSGTFSPTMKISIAIARVKHDVPERASVEIRGNLEPIRIVKLPFVRNGKVV